MRYIYVKPLFRLISHPLLIPLSDCLTGHQMQGVDPEGALRMYCEKGQWQHCLQLAEKQVLTMKKNCDLLVKILLCTPLKPFPGGSV